MRKSIIEKFQRFYNGDKTVVFTDGEIEHRDRMLHIINLKIKDIGITDLKVFEDVISQFEVSYPQVLRDIMIIERMIAADINPNGDPMKTFIRYFISEKTKQAIIIAEQKDDAKAISMLLNTLGKHHQTDKEDVIKPNYDKIVPFLPELTFDPSILGITLPENFDEEREAMRKKFETEYQNFARKLAIPEAEIVTDEDGN